MANMFWDTLLGRPDGDNNVPDDKGLTRIDKTNMMWDNIGKFGGALMAAGQPMLGVDRAKYLAAIGNIPQSQQEYANSITKQRGEQADTLRTNQSTQNLLQTNQMKQQLVDQFNDPNGAWKDVDPQTLSILKSQALAGQPVGQDMLPKVTAQGLVIDPIRRTITDPQTGQVFPLSANGTPLPGQQGGMGGLSAVPPPNPNLAPGEVDDAYLKTLPQQDQQQILAWKEGRQPVPSGISLRNPILARQLNEARRYDPGLDAVDFKERQKAATDMAPSGVTGKQIVSDATLLQHLGELHGDMKALDNGSVPWWNNVVNTAHSWVGDPAQNNFNITADKVAHELDTLVSGGKGSVSGTEQIRTELNSAKSPEQFQGVIDHYRELARARLDSAVNYNNQTLGKPYIDKVVQRYGVPKAIAADEMLQNNPLPGTARAKGATAAGGGGTNEGATATNKQTGQRIIFKGGQWQAM